MVGDADQDPAARLDHGVARVHLGEDGLEVVADEILGGLDFGRVEIVHQSSPLGWACCHAHWSWRLTSARVSPRRCSSASQPRLSIAPLIRAVTSTGSSPPPCTGRRAAGRCWCSAGAPLAGRRASERQEAGGHVAPGVARPWPGWRRRTGCMRRSPPRFRQLRRQGDDIDLAGDQLRSERDRIGDAVEDRRGDIVRRVRAKQAVVEAAHALQPAL